MNPINSQTNKANISAIGPWLPIIFMGLDAKFQWGFTAEWYGALSSLLIWLATYYIANKKTPTAPTTNSFFAVALLIMVAVILSGCSMIPYYPQMKAVADTGIATAITDRREFNDKKLAVNLSALCDSSVGAVNRYPDPAARDFINRMCGGDPSISLDALARTLELLKLAANESQQESTANHPVPSVTENPVVFEFDPEEEALPPLPEE